MSQRPFFLLSILLIAACGTPRTPASPDAPVTFIVLQLNDVYEIAPLEGGRVGGLARVATVRQELLRENPHVITVMAGDFLSPSFLGTMEYTTPDGRRERIAGLQMVETLSAVGLDYATFGNHEFDLNSLELLEQRIADGTFSYTVCNASAVTPQGTRPFRQADTLVPPYLIHRIGGLRIGLIGTVLPFNLTDYVAYADINTSFQRTLARVAPQTDLTLAITHQFVEQDVALAEAVPGVPLFLGGHEHVEMHREVNGTRITKADANAKSVYVHRIRYDPATGATTIASSVRQIDDTIAEEPVTKAVVDKWQTRAYAVMEEMGYAPLREVLRLTRPLECREAVIRTSQTNFGRLTTDAMAYALPGADAYLLNSGTMRLDDDLHEIVTEYDVLRTYPYGGKLVRIQLPGAVLQRTLETGLHRNFGEGGYLQVGGVAAAADTRLNATATYAVVLPEFLARGREANLEFLADYYDGATTDTLTITGLPVKNDFRELVILYMETLVTY